jgi:hypothetical protein
VLPVAAEIAVRTTRAHAQSALPTAPPQPDVPCRRPVSRPRRGLVVLLRRAAVLSGTLADRVERPLAAS